MLEDTQRVSAVHRLYSVVYSQERLTIELFFSDFCTLGWTIGRHKYGTNCLTGFKFCVHAAHLW